MRDLLISVNSNNLKLTYCGPEGCGGVSSTVSTELLKGPSIQGISDTQRFTKDLIALANEILPKNEKPEYLSFLLSPEDVFLFFVTINKNDGEVQEQIINSIKSKVDVPLEDLYFSYSKIAPFVYQFVGVRKELMEQLLEISTIWGVPVKSIAPWVCLLPKTLKNTDPAIFIANLGEKQVVALSELNGVYFAESYTEEKETSEIEALVRTLSIYKRERPISQIYTLNTSFSIGNGYKVLPVLASEEERLLSEGFEEHELFLKIAQSSPEVLETQVNLINLLPLPAPASPAKVLVPAALSLFLVSLLVGGYFLFFADSSSTELVPEESNQVLSETAESTPSAETGEISEGTSEETLEREDLSIRIENGAGINGAAGRTQEYLEEFGYSIDSIDTADNQYETTQVLIREDMEKYKELLREDLGADFPEPVFDLLEDNEAEYDVLILLGKNISI